MEIVAEAAKPEIVGRWWLPDREQHDEAGVLRIGDTGDMELSVFGLLGPIQRWEAESLPPTQIIWGLTNSHNLITLVSSLPRGFEHSMPGFAVERYSPQVALFGDHLTWEDLQFEAIRVSFPNLARWSGLSGLRRTVGISIRDVAITIDPPNVAEIMLADETRVNIEFTYDLPEISHVDEQMHVRYRFASEQSLDAASRYAADLRHLISIQAGMSVLPDRISLYTARRSGTPMDRDDPAAQPLDLVRPAVHSRPETDDRQEYLLTAGQHPTGIRGLLPAWHKTASRYRRVVDVASALYYAPQSYRNPELLLAASMAETLHRLSEHPQQVERENLARWRSLLATVPDQHREWLTSFVEEQSEPSLRRRLLDLVRALGDVGARMVRNVPHYELRLNRWRNAATHHGLADDLSGAHMYQLAKITRLVVELNLMLDSGYDLVAQLDWLESTSRFRSASQLRLDWPSLAQDQGS